MINILDSIEKAKSLSASNIFNVFQYIFFFISVLATYGQDCLWKISISVEKNNKC